MANKYHFDVKNCYYCPGERNADGTITFDKEKIRHEPGLRSIEFAPNGETTKIRADGIDYIVASSNNGYDITATFVQISDQLKVDLLGEVKDESTGIQYEDADAIPAPFALMGEFKGDKENIRWIFYSCTAARHQQTGDNKDNMKEPDEEQLSITASPLPVTINGVEKNIVRGGVKKSDKEATWTAWFTKVTLPGTVAQTP